MELSDRLEKIVSELKLRGKNDFMSQGYVPWEEPGSIKKFGGCSWYLLAPATHLGYLRREVGIDLPSEVKRGTVDIISALVISKRQDGEKWDQVSLRYNLFPHNARRMP